MALPSLYPINFKPIIKEKTWGCAHFKTLLNKSIDNDRCGELWEIADVNEDVSVVAEGSLFGKTLTEIIELYQADLIGERVFKKYGNKFPLLVKFIDANRDLSIQVHPNDKQAQEIILLAKQNFGTYSQLRKEQLYTLGLIRMSTVRSLKMLSQITL